MRYFFCLIFISSIFVVSADAAVIYPYLQDVTQHNVKVMWKTDSASTGSVEYGLTDSYGDTETETGSNTFHTVTLPGLQSDTVYHYKVTCGSDASTDNTFRTAPSSSSSFTFIAYGDSRGDNNNPDFNYYHEAVVNAMVSHNPRTFIVNVGDLTHNGAENLWQPQFFLPAKNIFKSNVLYPVLGNHDDSVEGRIFFADYFDVPAGSGSDFYYSFNYGNTHFIVLDTSQTYTNPSVQYTWLLDDLDSADAVSASWIIVIGHYPAYSSVPSGGTSEIKTDLVPLFETKRVAMYVCGHDHFYERSYKDGVYYLLTGGGGASLVPPLQGSNPYTIYSEEVFHHCLINMGQNGIIVTVYNNSNGIVDTFSILKKTWYLAEGCTSGFTEYILIQNPNDTAANITATFMDQDGNETPASFSINPHSRYTLNVNDIVSNKSIGAKIESTADNLSVERAMYWPVTGRNGTGGHCSKAIKTTDTKWYLAEGCTNGFDEYILILNPSETETAEVTVNFYDDAGNTEPKSFSINPHSRYTLYANDTMSGVSMSAVVTSTNNVPIVAERSMYWRSGDSIRTDGTCSFGESLLSPDWYFAEGCTAGFSEWILIYNPNGSSINITATFYDEGGNETTVPITVAANRRYTLNVNNSINADKAVSVKLHSASQFAAERAMYWDGVADGTGTLDWIGGHCSGGTATPSKKWHFAEGCTNGYNEYLLLYNPNSGAATVTITTMDEDGNTEEFSYSVNGNSRKTILVNSFLTGNNDVSLYLNSTETIVAERAMYWYDNGSSLTGGTCDLGTAETLQ